MDFVFSLCVLRTAFKLSKLIHGVQLMFLVFNTFVVEATASVNLRSDSFSLRVFLSVFPGLAF